MESFTLIEPTVNKVLNADKGQSKCISFYKFQLTCFLAFLIFLLIIIQIIISKIDKEMLADLIIEHIKAKKLRICNASDEIVDFDEMN